MKTLYNNNFDIRFKVPKQTMKIGFQEFIRKDKHPTNYSNHKFSLIATGPYNVTEVDVKTCVIFRENNVTERISLNRLVLAPQDYSTTGEEQNINNSRILKVLSHEPY